MHMQARVAGLGARPTACQEDLDRSSLGKELWTAYSKWLSGPQRDCRECTDQKHSSQERKKERKKQNH
jgi:hypothetical protein